MFRNSTHRRSEAQFTRVLLELREYVDAHGHAEVPYGYVTARGVRLGAWVSRKRHAYRTGQLAQDRIAVLLALGVRLKRARPDSPETSPLP